MIIQRQTNISKDMNCSILNQFIVAKRYKIFYLHLIDVYKYLYM